MGSFCGLVNRTPHRREINEHLQQLDFNVELNGYSMRDANSEVKVVVRQNNRIDNQVTDIKPTYFSGSAAFKEISMGMSGDYRIAIDEGSSIVRIGSLIFGKR